MASDIDLVLLKQSCRTHEGKVLKAGRFMQYTDTTGNLTEGYGHLVANGLSEVAAEQILDDDVRDALKAVSAYSWWPAACVYEPRARALAEMFFELGSSRFNGFHNAVGALSRNDWNTAADEFANSLWARQVGQRAVDLVAMIRGQ